MAFERINAPEFVRRAISADPDAFDELFAALAGPLAHFGEKMGFSPQDADENASDALLKVHDGLPGFQSRGNKLTTWIFQIALNCAIDRLRGLGRRSAHEEEILAEYARADPAMAQPPSARMGMLHQALHAATSQLTQADRDILFMREVMEYSDIARAEGISEKAARTRHKRAMDRLRQIIKLTVPHA